MPFVPGRVQGRLSLGEPGSGGIRVVHQDQVGHLEGRPDGLIVVEAAPFSYAMIGILDRAAFVALGCNDLMQTLFAADWDQPRLRRYLDPYAPVLYRFLGQVAASAEGRLDRVQVCGLLPQIRGVLPLLLGLGYRAFSVDTVMIPWLARVVRTTRLSDARALVERACLSRNARELRALLNLPG